MDNWKGTKGKWHLDSKTPKKGKYAATELVINFDEHMTSCVSVFCTIDEGSEEDLANAKLIAAAPELLDALKALMTEYESKGHILGYNIDIARKAINKVLK